MKDKKVVFMGTPLFAVPILEKLIEETNVILVVTQPDKCVGRHQEVIKSPIKVLAEKNNIEVFQPIKIKEDYEKILEKNPDIIITCAYGQIIPNILLETPKYKAINVHASLLPKLRGGAPIHKAIIKGYEKTGITIMYMNSKMDEGDIIKERSINIDNTDNVETLSDKLSQIGTELLLEVLPSIFNNTNERIKQNEIDATYAYNVTREEEKIDFNKSEKDVYNQIRGLYPYPTSYGILLDKEIKILEAKISDSTKGEIGQITDVTKEGIVVKCKDKSVVITKLKPSGKKEMSALDYVNGIGKKNIIGVKFNG